MNDPTIIAFDFTEISGDPKVTVAKLPSEMTVKHLKRRIMHIAAQLNLRYGLLALYHRGILLRNHVKMGDLPQGTVCCKLIKPLALHPIREIDDRYCCIFCGQDYFSDNVNNCEQCS